MGKKAEGHKFAAGDFGFENPYVYAEDKNLEAWESHFRKKKIPYVIVNHPSLKSVKSLVIDYTPGEG